MERLNLVEFERRVRLRPVRIEDFDQLVELQLACFPGMPTWSREHVESQLAHFPEGQICIEYEGRLVASCATLIVDSAEDVDWHNWSAVSDRGFIRNHDYEGDVLYGIEIMVHPEYRGMRLARRLYNARKDLARRYNCKTIIIGGRIPGYGKHADTLSARDYVQRVIDKKLFDPVLTAQLANGFVLKRLIPNYLPGDAESRGYATFLEWTNLDYIPEHRRRVTRVVEPVRLAVVQYGMRPVTSFEEMSRQVEFFVDAAADQKADYLLFPELFTTQLLSLTPNEVAAEQARKLAAYTPEYLDLFTDMAVRFDLNIVGGSTIVEEEDSLYNVAYLFRRDGTLEKQYKIHITPEERRWWGVQPGRTVRVFDTDHGKVAILVGYDVEFPELLRVATHQGARLVFVPFNASDRAGYLRMRYCAQARCIENHVYVATAGVVGNLPFVDYADIHYAESGIYTPCDVSFARDGVAAECTPNVEMVLVQDLDLELLRRHRQLGTELNWKDRRLDVYSVIYRERPAEPGTEI
ncbi:MAG: bifunctional GNAT family N-acetyltransferase/carbon-nitrogen hydrolase family protein [Myxococcales bacterium]|nr:bifunctional GNAT family N-acetyltransferase/carbon-nitrogen hydrolase family protein [Myxococcales bacterium]MCB9649705.1 bifunctional GNAT family N-acetyltransferase/carbon-nitrogen hydrolase family protein [Deltaproteobacteria bacterium]